MDWITILMYWFAIGVFLVWVPYFRFKQVDNSHQYLFNYRLVVYTICIVFPPINLLLIKNILTHKE